MRMNMIWTMVKKEWIGVLRDRKAMFMMFVMSLLLYPLLFGVVGMVIKNQEDKFAESNSRVAVVGVPQQAEPLVAEMKKAGHYEFVEASNPVEQLENQELDAVLRFEVQGDNVMVLVEYDERYGASSKTLTRIQSLVEPYKQQVVEQRLQAKGLSPEVLQPVVVKPTNVSAEQGTSMLSFLPYILAISLIAGSLNLGVEITAGEKERGTITTLLVSQFSRYEIALAKLITILGLSILSVVLNILSLLIGVVVLTKATGFELPPNVFAAINPATIGMLFAVMLPLACMASALIVFLGTYARNSKEGNAYSMPLLFLMMGLGLASSGMDANVSLGLYAVPFLGPILGIKQVLYSTGNMPGLLTAIGTSLVYTALLIVPAVKLYEREDIIFRT